MEISKEKAKEIAHILDIEHDPARSLIGALKH